MNSKKMKRLYFCFNFCGKKKENIALLENKKFREGCFKPSAHSLLNFQPGFLINQVGMSAVSMRFV